MMIALLDEWYKRAEEGTSGDMVYDILKDWSAYVKQIIDSENTRDGELRSRISKAINTLETKMTEINDIIELLRLGVVRPTISGNSLETPLLHKVPEKESYCCGCWSLTWNPKTTMFHAICNECGINFDIESDITILWRPISKP